MSSPQSPTSPSSCLNPEASNFVPIEASHQHDPSHDESKFTGHHQNNNSRWTCPWTGAKHQGTRGGARGGGRSSDSPCSMVIVPGGSQNDAGGNDGYTPQVPDHSTRRPWLANLCLSSMTSSNHNRQSSEHSTHASDTSPQPREGVSSEAKSGETSSSSGDILPLYGQAITWKSDYIKSQDEFIRKRQRLRAVAPEMLKDKAKPSGEPADVFPRNTVDWIKFKAEGVKQRLDEINKSVLLMKRQVESAENMERNGVSRPTILPAFGDKAGQKTLSDTFGAVLSQRTIWSHNNVKAGGPKANWPTRAELLCHGDNRESDHTDVRVGRSLPPPRFPPERADMSFQEQELIAPYPFDQTAVDPVNMDGKLKMDTSREVDVVTKAKNEDHEFEPKGMELLGAGLMDEIGLWQKPVVPAWQEKQRQKRGEVDKANREGQMPEEEKIVRADAATKGTPLPQDLRYFGPDDTLRSGTVYADRTRAPNPTMTPLQPPHCGESL